MRGEAKVLLGCLGNDPMERAALIEIIVCKGNVKREYSKITQSFHSYYPPKKNLLLLLKQCHVYRPQLEHNICLSACQETDSIIFRLIVSCILLSLFNK